MTDPTGPGWKPDKPNEPMTQNQKFTLLVFVLMLGVVVFLVYQSIASGF